MGRLAGGTSHSGQVGLNFNATYDRHGNRWSQTVSNTASGINSNNPSLAFDPTTNRINNITGLSYDAVGNMVSDGMSNYQYDAENNLIAVSGGYTAVFAYDPLNRRVKAQMNGVTDRYGLDLSGRRSTTWLDGATTLKLTQFYSDRSPVAFWSASDSHNHFEHGDWLGTDHIRTNNTGATESTFATLPFGDNVGASGPDLAPGHFALLDQDFGNGATLHHAMFREYSASQGRWTSPDPYQGSYDAADPQSYNRYAYTLNNPLGGSDPDGLYPINATPSPRPDRSTQQQMQDENGSGGGYSLSCQTVFVSFDVDGVFAGYDDGTLNCSYAYSGNTSRKASSGAPSNLTPPNPCLFQGNAMSPGQYAAAGAAASALGPAAFLGISGAGFPRGSFLDAQPQASGNVFQRAAYGNYSFGVYMASAGVPYAATMATANAFAMFSHYTAKNGPMDSTYTNLPNANVVNITSGFNAARSGTTCHR